MTISQKLLLSVLAAYRKILSPLLPASCRFYPSCSQYAAAAVTRHGAGKGGFLAFMRLMRCHPWHQGGFDPVPEPGQTDETGRPDSTILLHTGRGGTPQ